MLTPGQKQEAAERGAEWGKQEAELTREAIENGHRKTWPEWTMGTYCGKMPDGEEREEYKTILDRAAKAVYEAAVGGAA